MGIRIAVLPFWMLFEFFKLMDAKMTATTEAAKTIKNPSGMKIVDMVKQREQNTAEGIAKQGVSLFFKGIPEYSETR